MMSGPRRIRPPSSSSMRWPARQQGGTGGTGPLPDATTEVLAQVPLNSDSRRRLRDGKHARRAFFHRPLRRPVPRDQRDLHARGLFRRLGRGTGHLHLSLPHRAFRDRRTEHLGAAAVAAVPARLQGPERHAGNHRGAIQLRRRWNTSAAAPTASVRPITNPARCGWAPIRPSPSPTASGASIMSATLTASTSRCSPARARPIRC